MSRRARTVVVTVAIALTGARTGAQSVVAFTHVSVIDARDSMPRRDQTVIVRGNRIIASAPARTAHVPANARIVDGRGKFLIPGLWDMHVHTAIVGGRELLGLYVANGVTGVRDMAGDWATIKGWRDEIARGTLIGPAHHGLGSVPRGRRRPHRAHSHPHSGRRARRRRFTHCARRRLREGAWPAHAGDVLRHCAPRARTRHPVRRPCVARRGLGGGVGLGTAQHRASAGDSRAVHAGRIGRARAAISGAGRARPLLVGGSRAALCAIRAQRHVGDADVRRAGRGRELAAPRSSGRFARALPPRYAATIRRADLPDAGQHSRRRGFRRPRDVRQANGAGGGDASRRRAASSPEPMRRCATVRPASVCTRSSCCSCVAGCRRSMCCAPRRGSRRATSAWIPWER